MLLLLMTLLRHHAVTPASLARVQWPHSERRNRAFGLRTGCSTLYIITIIKTTRLSVTTVGVAGWA